MTVDLAPLLDGTVGDLRDVDGRPLGEIGSPRYADVTTRVVPCPYDDRRHGKPMNVSALAQIKQHWPGILARFGAWSGDATIFAAWRACTAMVALPLREREPVAAVAAGAYKSALGFWQVFTWLLLAEDGMASRPLRELGDGATLHGWLDRDGWLHGREQVCAGPPAMIVELFEVFATGHRREREPDDDFVDAAVDALVAQAGAVLEARDRDRAGLPSEPRARTWLRSGRSPFLHAVTRDPDLRAGDAARLLPATTSEGWSQISI